MSTHHFNEKANIGLGGRIWNKLCSPGKQYAIRSAAPTLSVAINKNESSVVGELLPEVISADKKIVRSAGSRFFDRITSFSGSRFSFVTTLAIILGWSIAGIVLGAPANWQIAFSDGGSIQCYISDSFLMRQQHIQCDKLLSIIGQLRSRNITYKRLLLNPQMIKKINELKLNANLQMPTDNVGDAVKLPLENWFDKLCTAVSNLIGSIYSVVFYWAAIFVWVGTGTTMDWNNMWQLYINCASALQLTFSSMFLQHTRRIHMEYFDKCLASVMDADRELESLLRQATGDCELNPVIEIPAVKVSHSVRFIDYYADLVGSGVGAFISTCVFIAWLAVGNVMQWDSNWWLIIGTYTGLIGYIDGFVLRNVYFRQDTRINEQFQKLIDEDFEIFQQLNLEAPEEHLIDDKSLIYRMSYFMGVICSSPASVMASFLITLGLVCMASAMLWNETAQLICNTPTMIIEGFLFNVLIQAHNVANTKRRVVMHDTLLRRLKLIQYVRPVVDNSAKTEMKAMYGGNQC
ncbi:low-affinity Fe(2+) transport protein [Basidiobolus ranarum]|uniref:Low-affinity Fe(2+) transport protein n=1 Tax=Basidiobolus ranarum TaxID=34480 RepID=A0ABR2VSN7_9FUNG